MQRGTGAWCIQFPVCHVRARSRATVAKMRHDPRSSIPHAVTRPDIPEQDLVELLAATARGNQASFARLYTLTSPHLLALLVRMLKRMDWAEEALQDCYMRVWRRSESYAPDRGSPMAWLSTIARYRALDLLRARRPEVIEAETPENAPSLTEHADETARPDLRAAERQELQRLEGCMRRLSGDERRSVLLAYYEGYTHSELSSRLAAPLGTVKSWVRRGLQQLRDCLGSV
ncbi:MAG: sigma-70 family RNA polymerase sigma factor [Nevskiaceae bacterium]